MSEPYDPYLAYYAAMTRVGITPLSREWYYRAIAAKPAKPVSDIQFDHDREREGDAQ